MEHHPNHAALLCGGAQKIHLIGVAGSGMSGLAGLLLAMLARWAGNPGPAAAQEGSAATTSAVSPEGASWP